MGVLEDGLSDKFWPPLVKEISITKDYPGYKYEFFDNYEDLDKYFTDLCGDDWVHQPWAQYWIGQHKLTQRRNKLEIKIMMGEIDPSKTRTFVNYDQIAASIQQIKDKLGRKVSVLKIIKELNDSGLNVSKNTVYRVIKKYNL